MLLHCVHEAFRLSKRAKHAVGAAKQVVPAADIPPLMLRGGEEPDTNRFAGTHKLTAAAADAEVCDEVNNFRDA